MQTIPAFVMAFSDMDENTRELMIAACERGYKRDLITINRILYERQKQNTSNENTLDTVLLFLCTYADLDVVQRFMGPVDTVRYYREWDYPIALAGAAYTGKTENMKYMMEECKRRGKSIGLSYAMQIACMGGHIKAIDLLADYNEKSTHPILFSNPMTGAMNRACFGGHLRAVRHLESLYPSTFENCISGACASQNIEVVEYVANKLINTATVEIQQFEFNDGLYTCCNSTVLNRQLAEFMIKCGATDVDGAFLIACRANGVDLVDCMCRNGVFDFRRGFAEAIATGEMDVVRYLVLIISTEDMNQALMTTLFANNLYIARFLVLHGARSVMLSGSKSFFLHNAYCDSLIANGTGVSAELNKINMSLLEEYSGFHLLLCAVLTPDLTRMVWEFIC